MRGQVELVLETPIVSGGKVRAPHQAPGPEAINEAGEELLGSAISSSRRSRLENKCSIADAALPLPAGQFRVTAPQPVNTLAVPNEPETRHQ